MTPRAILTVAAGCAGLAGYAGLTGCDAALDQRLAIIDQPRVLAVIAEPAEVKPGGTVSYRAVIASPDGPPNDPPDDPADDAPSWAFCTAPKPPTEDNSVSAACLVAKNLMPLGTAPTVSAALPSNGCLQFGPETPPGNFRPRDADSTGGYYQPVRVDAGDLLAFGLTRITCHLATAPAIVAHDYDLQYAANRNPTLDPPVVPGAAADTDVTLTASWPAEAAESYLFYDPLSQTLVTRREAMRLSWFATGGTLAVDASAVDEDDPATAVSTTWHTPAAGPATVWFVLRDSRGGIATQVVHVDVAP
ncbi:MAG TPA: hypothetical protein VH165_33870 [Kofleriaceae bacterium]|nr:hypothetical protein [Kofleriaceae bacterium]